jgi:hypothetical protein
MLALGVIVFFWLILVSRALFSSYFNPLSFYSLVWGSVCLLYQIELIGVPVLRWQALVVFAIGHGAFVLGSMIPPFARTRRTGKFKAPAPKITRVRPDFLKKALLLLICLYALRVLIVVIDVQRFPGGFDTFLNNPWRIRAAYASGEYDNDFFARGILLDLGGVGMSSLVIAGYLLAVSPRKSLLFFLPVIMSISEAALNTQRASAMVATLIFTASYMYTVAFYSTSNFGAMNRIRFRVRHALLALLVAVVFISAVTAANEIIMHKSRNWQNVAVDAKVDNPIINKTYWYIVGSMPAFDRHLQKSERDLKMGAYTFNVVAQPLARLGLIDEQALMPLQLDPVKVTYETNVYTYFYPFYEDFDLLGVVVFPFLFGSICSLSYLYMRQRFSLSWLALNAILAMTILFSFPAFMLTDRRNIFLIIAVHIIERLLIRRYTNKRPLMSVNR